MRSTILSTASHLGDLSAPLSTRRKVQLSGEVLVVYCRARWLLRHHRLDDVVARLREVGDIHPSHGRRSNGLALDSQSAHLTGLRLGRAVSRTLKPLPTDSRCLVRSLVLTALLARRGLSSSLVIAVRSQPEFEAHAWVEHAGTPLLDTGGGGFERLLEL